MEVEKDQGREREIWRDRKKITHISTPDYVNFDFVYVFFCSAITKAMAMQSYRLAGDLNNEHVIWIHLWFEFRPLERTQDFNQPDK